MTVAFYNSRVSVDAVVLGIFAKSESDSYTLRTLKHSSGYVCL